MRELAGVLFPVQPVERPDFNRFHHAGIETTHVDTITVRIRARNVKRLDATNFAKQVPCHSGVKAILDQKLLTAQEGKLILCNDEVEKSALAANGAVAFERFDFGGRQNRKPHPAAMAPAGVFAKLVTMLGQIAVTN